MKNELILTEGMKYGKKSYCHRIDRREIKEEVETDWNKKQRTTFGKGC